MCIRCQYWYAHSSHLLIEQNLKELEEQPEPESLETPIHLIFNALEGLPSLQTEELRHELLTILLDASTMTLDQLEVTLKDFANRAMSSLPNAQVLDFPNKN